MLRDGGSLCATFVGANSCEYALIVRIELASRGSPDFESRYSAPVVVEGPIAATSIQVSWEHAAILLRQVVAMLPAGASRFWIAPMAECLARRGDISYSEVMAITRLSPP